MSGDSHRRFGFFFPAAGGVVTKGPKRRWLAALQRASRTPDTEDPTMSGFRWTRVVLLSLAVLALTWAAAPAARYFFPHGGAHFAPAIRTPYHPYWGCYGYCNHPLNYHPLMCHGPTCPLPPHNCWGVYCP